MSSQWDFYFSNVNNSLASIFVDLGLQKIAPSADNPWLLWVWVQFNHPREDGLSSAEEYAVLLQIEDSLKEAVGTAVNGFPAGRITTDGRREFYFYGPTFAGFDDAVARCMELFPKYKWDSGTQEDADWNHYREVLYPTPRGWEQLNNRHVIEQLQSHGDPLTRERTVFHWAYFPNEASRATFVAGVRKLGFAVTDEGTVDDPNSLHPFSVSFERVDKVDWNSINVVTIELFELANSLSGEYDGWETSVEAQE